MDKRAFHVLLNELKDQNPDSFDLLESIQGTFENEVEAISDSERRALKTFPVQFIPRIPTDRGEWTTQLHIWAENGIPDILSVDPLMLAHKNSYGDTVLMCLISAATGTFTEVVNYDLIKKILNTDFSYEEKESTPDKEKVIIKNVIDETDINGQTIIDYLIDFAYGTGIFAGQEADTILQQILVDFSSGITDESTEIEVTNKLEEQERNQPNTETPTIDKTVLEKMQ